MLANEIEGLWTHIRCLVVLQEQGTYTAAAARLGMSKSVISQRISELEKAAGVPLVVRTTRSVRLTDAGLSLYEGAREAYARIEASFVTARDTATTLSGSLRITAPVAFARQQLIPRLTGFLSRYPHVRVQVDVSDTLSSLTAEGYDLAVRHSFQIPDTHVAWTLCDTASLLVATPDYLQRRGEPRQPEHLSEHNCLYYPRSAEKPAWTLQRERADGDPTARVTVPISGNLATNNSEALRDAALQDLGIALLPDFSAQAALRDGRLRRVLPDWNVVGAFASQIHVIRPYSRHVPNAVKALVDYLRESLAEGFSAG
ncbi:LysR family transcriptional regulator [Pseudomonas sp.]|uniref:LysR family transcriptional regulator n=1 Tax=Pseudomonas sp. TaxID=306 RepID=UPI0028A95169|nr:LysR family transcriptional regulator [Pseudomonas sp.]